MSEAQFVMGLLASSLGPALLVAWLVRRWMRRIVLTALAVALIGGAAWLGGGAFWSQALSGFSVQMN